MEKLEHKFPIHKLEKLAAGILSGDEERRTREHVDSCPVCKQRMEDVIGDREAFLVTHPPQAQARKLLEQTRKQSLFRGWFVPIGAIPVAAGIALFLFMTPVEQDDDIRFKGERARFLVKDRGTGRMAPLQGAEPLSAGDAIQISVTPPNTRYVAVYALNARGELNELLEQETRGPTDLGSSLVLDNSPEPERLFVIFSNRRLDLAAVEKAAKQAFRDSGNRLEKIQTLEIRGLDIVVNSVFITKSAPEEGIH